VDVILQAPFMEKVKKSVQTIDAEFIKIPGFEGHG
jgi:hypothetical protein